jgi:hypothetical protein
MAGLDRNRENTQDLANRTKPRRGEICDAAPATDRLWRKAVVRTEAVSQTRPLVWMRLAASQIFSRTLKPSNTGSRSDTVKSRPRKHRR